MVQSPCSTMLLEALRINVLHVSCFGLVLPRHQTCHVKQHFKEKRKTSIQSVIVAGYIIIKCHFRMTSGLCNWPPQHEVDLLFTLFCCETPMMFFFLPATPAVHTENATHTKWIECLTIYAWFGLLLVPGGGSGRGRTGALVLVVLVGFCPTSFIADADGEAATGRLGWTDKKKEDFFFKHGARPNHCVCCVMLEFADVCVCVCVYLWSRRVVHLGFEDL